MDWAAVKASGCTFAICKASEGVGFTADRFKRNWAGIRAAGLRRGCYHFAQPEAATATEDADYFLSVLNGDVAPEDILALDIEAGSGDLSTWVLTWVNRVEAATGLVPYIYSGKWFLDAHDLSLPELARYPLWLAAYQAECPPAPAPWTFIKIWQKSDKGAVPGIRGMVDEDVMFPDPVATIIDSPTPEVAWLDTLKALVGHTQTELLAVTGQPDAIDNSRGDQMDYFGFYGLISGETIEVRLDSGIVKDVRIVTY